MCGEHIGEVMSLAHVAKFFQSFESSIDLFVVLVGEFERDADMEFTFVPEGLRGVGCVIWHGLGAKGCVEGVQACFMIFLGLG